MMNERQRQRHGKNGMAPKYIGTMPFMVIQ